MPTLALYAFAGYRLMPNLQNIYGAAISIKFGRSILDLILEDLGHTKPSDINNGEHQEKKKIDFNNQIDLSNIKFRYKGTKIT